MMKDSCQPEPSACRHQNEDLSLINPIQRRKSVRWASLLGIMLFLFGCVSVPAQTSMSEYKVKALFLLNFVKYVDWPVTARPEAANPIIIGILGQDHFSDSLTQAVEGKNFNGREIIIKHLSADDDPRGCSILFISASENSRLNEILSKTSALPILTVGENASFLEKGGIINFTLKDEKIRLEINLNVAQKVKLQISSKLLSVADAVKE